MIERPVGYVALSAPFAAVAVELVPHFPGGQVAVASAAAGALVVGLLTYLQRDALDLPNLLVAAALLVTAGVVTLAPASFGPYGPAIFVGLLIGGPWVLVGYVARHDGPLGIRLLVYGVAITWGLFLLASASGAVGVGPSATSSAYETQFFALVAQQFQVFGGLLTGAASPPLPLNQFFDPVYSATVAVSVVGLLLVTARPQTGLGAPLPVAVRTYRSVDAQRDFTGAYSFTPAQRGVFQDRSTGETPLATWPPGLEPVFYGAVAAAAFLVGAYFVPVWTVPAAVGAVAIAAFGLVRTTDRPVEPPARAPPPPTDLAPSSPEVAPATDSVEPPASESPSDGGGAPAPASGP